MERGAWEELPAGVYARGFLRNYAIYLGLDPDEVLAAWGRERGEVPVEPSIVVPRPIEAPRRGIVLGPGIIVAALVTLAALAIIAYIGFQLLRFSEPPPLTVTDPPTAVIEVAEDTTSYTLRGTTVANGEVTIQAPGREDLRVLAGGDGGLAHGRRPAPRREPLRRHGHRPQHRQGGRGAGRDRHHRALRPGRRADARAHLAGGGPQRRERGDPGPRDARPTPRR